MAKETYSITKTFPRSETYSLISQIQRSAVSVPSNIAEGTAKRTDKHFLQYLDNALGSAFEWETQLIIAFEVGYISEEKFKLLEKGIQTLQGMITRFIENIEKNLNEKIN